VYKSPIYGQSRKVIGKRKKLTLDKYLRISVVQFFFKYHVFLLRYFNGTEKSAFRAKLAKIGSFLSITLQKKGKLKFPKSLHWGKRRSTT